MLAGGALEAVLNLPALVRPPSEPPWILDRRSLSRTGFHLRSSLDQDGASGEAVSGETEKEVGGHTQGRSKGNIQVRVPCNR